MLAHSRTYKRRIYSRLLIISSRGRRYQSRLMGRATSIVSFLTIAVFLTTATAHVVRENYFPSRFNNRARARFCSVALREISCSLNSRYPYDRVNSTNFSNMQRNRVITEMFNFFIRYIRSLLSGTAILLTLWCPKRIFASKKIIQLYYWRSTHRAYLLGRCTGKCVGTEVSSAISYSFLCCCHHRLRIKCEFTRILQEFSRKLRRTRSHWMTLNTRYN